MMEDSSRSRTSKGMRTRFGTRPRSRPPRTVPVMEASVMVMTKGLLCPSTAKLLSRLKRAHATSMVGSDTHQCGHGPDEDPGCDAEHRPGSGI